MVASVGYGVTDRKPGGGARSDRDPNNRIGSSIASHYRPAILSMGLLSFNLFAGIYQSNA